MGAPFRYPGPPLDGRPALLPLLRWRSLLRWLPDRLVGPGRRLLTGGVVACGVGLAAADAGVAQDLGDVRLDRAGTLVRVHASTVAPRAFEGRVQRLREDSILVVRLDGGQEVEVSRSRIDRLEFSTGRHGHPWWGAVIGTVVIGIPAAIYWSRECEGGSSCDQAGVKGFLAGGAIFGALPGFVIGSLARTQDWRILPLVYLESAVVRRNPMPARGAASRGRLPSLSAGWRIPMGGGR